MLRHNLDLWVCRSTRTLSIRPLIVPFVALVPPLSTTNNWPIPANQQTTNGPQQCRNVDERPQRAKRWFTVVWALPICFFYIYSSFKGYCYIFITQPCWRQGREERTTGLETQTRLASQVRVFAFLNLLKVEYVYYYGKRPKRQSTSLGPLCKSFFVSSVVIFTNDVIF